jgi:hypothetical protein
MKIKQASQIE